MNTIKPTLMPGANKETVTVVFIARHGVYQPGERAGFLPEAAQRLVNDRIAAWPQDKEPEGEEPAEVEQQQDSGDPPWKAGERPTKDQFVDHYGKAWSKAQIVERAKLDFGLDLDGRKTKPELLTEVFEVMEQKRPPADEPVG